MENEFHPAGGVMTTLPLFWKTARSRRPFGGGDVQAHGASGEEYVAQLTASSTAGTTPGVGVAVGVAVGAGVGVGVAAPPLPGATNHRSPTIFGCVEP